jgi:hypothetical protein
VWFAAALVSGIALLPFGTGRYMLPALAPVVILLAVNALKASRAVASGIGCTLALSLLLCASDYIHASQYQRAAETLLQQYGAKNKWFTSDWGLRYYLERGGAHYLTSHNTAPAPGDIVITAENCSHHAVAPQLELRLQPIETIELNSSLPVCLLNREAGAGFYSHAFGLLPFSFSRAPLDRLGVYVVSR